MDKYPMPVSSLVARSLLAGNPGKPVVILGAGVVGRSLVRMLVSSGFHPVIVDEAKLSPESRSLLRDCAGGHEITFFDSWSGSSDELQALKEVQAVLGIFSSGIMTTSSFYRLVASTGMALIGEMDFALSVLGQPQVAVTGTNGKTTTVSLLDFIFKRAERDSCLLGNVGTAFSSLVEPSSLLTTTSAPKSSVIAEVSSYQLESSTELHPKVAICLNITPDHLDKHGSLESYVEAKGRIFAHQTASDWAVVYADDPLCLQAVSAARSSLVQITANQEKAQEKAREPSGQNLVTIKGCILTLCLSELEEVYDLESANLFGHHNMVNAASAIAASRILGIPQSVVLRATLDFEPLQHRIQKFSSVRDVVWINDSKSTNVDSVEVAVRAVSERYPGLPVSLLVGGLSKGGPWENIRNYCGKPLREVVFFGQDRLAIAACVIPEGCAGTNGGEPPCQHVIGGREEGSGGVQKAPDQTKAVDQVRYSLMNTLQDATKYLATTAEPGTVVLLSPGGASFDEFKNYADRGEKFMFWVKEFSSLTGTTTKRETCC